MNDKDEPGKVLPFRPQVVDPPVTPEMILAEAHLDHESYALGVVVVGYDRHGLLRYSPSTMSEADLVWLMMDVIETVRGWKDE